MELKSGLQSSEFWFNLLIAVAPIMVNAFVPFMGPAAAGVAVALSAALAAQYHSGRVSLKQTTLDIAAEAASKVPVPAPVAAVESIAAQAAQNVINDLTKGK